MLKHIALERPLAVIDLETTGVDPKCDRIIEVSVLKLAPGGEADHRTRRVNPGVPIPPEATAVHGITDDELRRAKGQIEGALTLSLEDSDARMTRLGRSELGTGEYTDLSTALERVDGVTTDGVLELARDLLTRPTITSVVGAVQQDELAAAIGMGS